jgi:hypothetical protein
MLTIFANIYRSENLVISLKDEFFALATKAITEKMLSSSLLPEFAAVAR